MIGNFTDEILDEEGKVFEERIRISSFFDRANWVA